MKRYIMCMSKSRSEIRDRLENVATQCMTHIAKIWLFPTSESQKHWKREVWAFYNEIDRMKPTNKVPSAKFIFNSSWGLKNHLKEKAIQRAVDSEETLIPDKYRLNNLQILYDNMEKYFKWMSETLHNEELISLEAVMKEFGRLGM